MSEGWVKLHREIQNNWVWEMNENFDKRSAWIDLILMVNHKDKKFALGNELVEVKRGETITSQSKLADRWGWSRTKVRNFLNMLESDDMIKKQVKNNKRTRLKVLNYGRYQGNYNCKNTAEKQVKNRSETGKKQVKNTNKNVKNEKNEKNNNISVFQNNCIHPDKKCNKDDINCEVKDCPLLNIFNHYVKTFEGIYKPRVFSSKRKKKVAARLKEYSEDEIKQAITNIRKSDYHIGESDNNDKVYAKLEFVCRNDEKVEEWLNYSPSKNKNGKPQDINFL